MVSDQLRAYLKDNSLLRPEQYGFRKGSSTLDQLLDIYDKMMTSLDDKMVMKLLFLDVSKGFDKVWLEGLLHKLEVLGISGCLLSYFRSYLTGREQRVVIRGTMSSWIGLKAGVPQESILGPLLSLCMLMTLLKA